MEAFNLHAPQYKDIDLLYSIIKQDPDFLHAFDRKQFVETPLHFAAGEGRKELALEIQRLMPSFGMKLNSDGFSPLHLALQRGHTETVRAMIRLNPELVGVQAREGITSLHYAAEIDDVDMLAEFVVKCPDSIEKLTDREETALHVAVKFRKLAALKVLVGWMRRKDKLQVLEWKDCEGNTVLHLAASTNQPEVLEILVKRLYRLNKKNNQELTALDLVMQLPKHQDNERALSILNCRRWVRTAKMGSSIKTIPLAEYLSSKETYWESKRMFGEYLENGIPDAKRSTALVVAALIATASYQGMLRPPSVFSNQIPLVLNNSSSFHANSTVGLDVLVKAQGGGAYNISRTDLIEREIFVAAGFMLPNCIASAVSLGLIFLLIPFSVHSSFIHVSLFLLMLTIYVMVESIVWSQPDLEVGAFIGGLSFAAIFMILLYMKVDPRKFKRPHEI